MRYVKYFESPLCKKCAARLKHALPIKYSLYFCCLNVKSALCNLKSSVSKKNMKSTNSRAEMKAFIGKLSHVAVICLFCSLLFPLCVPMCSSEILDVLIRVVKKEERKQINTNQKETNARWNYHCFQLEMYNYTNDSWIFTD